MIDSMDYWKWKDLTIVLLTIVLLVLWGLSISRWKDLLLFLWLLGLSISRWKDLLLFLWLLLLLLFFFFFFFILFSSATFRIQTMKWVYDISFWNFIYDIGHPKSIRSEVWLTEPFSVTELSPLTPKTLCALLLLNRKRYRSKTFCKLLRVLCRNFVTFRLNGSDHFL